MVVSCRDRVPSDAETTSSPIVDQAVVDSANAYLHQAPVPLTTYTAVRSAGGPNDFFSEGDYWWPDPDNPGGPYVRRDGETNPDNFDAHRVAMRRLSRWVSTLVAAYRLDGDERYAAHAMRHLDAFFLDPATRMNPSLLYAQAIQGRFTGRGIGIIDTIHLIEVAQAIRVLIDAGYLGGSPRERLVAWFDDYATWLTTHPYGIDERDHGNNHSTWWATQVAAFAKLAGREDLMALSRKRYKELLTAQMNAAGGFTDELGRTKPYSYSLFNLEGYSVLAEIASTPEDRLWDFACPNGSLHDAWNFMLPAIEDKATWAYPPDIAHFDEVPIRSPGMLFAARAYEDDALLRAYERLSPLRESEEVDRTFPLRQVVLWLPGRTT